MALTFRRWLGLALGMAALSAAVLLRPSPRQEASVAIGRDSLWRGALRASGNVSVAVQRLRALELVDSVRRARPANDTARLIVDPRLPRMVREPLRALVARGGMLSPAARHPTRVIIVRDMLDTLRGVDATFGFQAGHYLLPADAGEPCTILVRVRPVSPTRFSYPGWQRSLEHQLRTAGFGGPCAWYEAFGTPGPRVRDWLDRGAWRFATYGPEMPPDSTQWRPEDWGYRNVVATDWGLRFFVTLDAYRCATGDASRCADEVLLTGNDPASDGDRVRDMRLFGTRRWHDGLGPRQHQYLAGIAASAGPERFARFWQSDEPVAEAFQRHVGEDIGGYTLRWTQRNYGDEHGRGPGLPVGAALFGLVIGSAALAAALLKRRRRELA